ncbi:MAG: PAS-domain containing protein [Pseudotabrizicola sp.]|uniref:PAS domain-containing hybrid sensor histidine kinase/response regulator n=1 Tax=Pseudotabrizicola sp. TaxID=2939647 RepID=UPI002730C4B9|nr:PAS-domain containing protein [Pseudotabrizicola sp.]MDP2082589.1 PAS-domain containing protein [Pseudotabrizicola sp.]MDZ7573485.1 PAS-domain containing protein [Pseudotabrizicola sp.]
MIDTLINPADPPKRQMEKLMAITQVLMRRVESDTDDSGAAYAQFQRAAMLEDQVRDRTRDLERALDLLNESNARLGEANRSAEAARQNLANAIETIQEGFALFDAGDVLVLCNSRFGMHMEDIRDDLRPGLRFDAYVDRVSLSRFLALPDRETPQDWAIRRKRRHQDRHVIFNVRMIWDRWVQVSEHRTADGGTVILQTDVTDIIRSERQERGKLLDDQARMIRATLDHINQGVSIFDAQARLVGWNARLGQLLSIPLARFRVGASFDYLLERFREEITLSDGMTDARLGFWVNGAPGRSPLSFELRRGDELILAVFAQGMPDGGFVMSFTDVTAERAAIEALSRANETLEARVMDRTLELEDALAHAERANASRSRFVAAASHDLLQPLSAAKLFIASIGGEGVPPSAVEALEKAQNALVSVEGILDALLDISKLESGRAAVSVGQVALRPILTQLEAEFTAIAAAKGLRLTVRAVDAVVMTDPAYLRRILQNLIGNAIRYTTQGRVVVAARKRGAMTRLEVWDTGPGIPDEEQDNIFKEFHRLNARASASEGMGLGLAIVERACALLGHPLGLSSRLGRGTCFMLQVPSVTAEDTMPVPHPVPPRPRMRLQGKIGFLVENDPDLCRALSLLLEKWGLSVLDAASGEQALALIDELGILPDFFLVDHQLGDGMTGVDFILALRRLHGDVPTRLVTADRRPQVHEQARLAGVEVMMKPIDARALESFLRDLD